MDTEHTESAALLAPDVAETSNQPQGAASNEGPESETSQNDLTMAQGDFWAISYTLETIAGNLSRSTDTFLSNPTLNSRAFALIDARKYLGVLEESRIGSAVFSDARMIDGQTGLVAKGVAAEKLRGVFGSLSTDMSLVRAERNTLEPPLPPARSEEWNAWAEIARTQGRHSAAYVGTVNEVKSAQSRLRWAFHALARAVTLPDTSGGQSALGPGLSTIVDNQRTLDGVEKVLSNFQDQGTPVLDQAAEDLATQASLLRAPHTAFSCLVRAVSDGDADTAQKYLTALTSIFEEWDKIVLSE